MADSSHVIVKGDGSTLTVTTDHAWEKPRGEVYIELHDKSTDELMDFALSPKQARELALALPRLASHAARKPERTLDENGDRINSNEEEAA